MAIRIYRHVAFSIAALASVMACVSNLPEPLTTDSLERHVASGNFSIKNLTQSVDTHDSLYKFCEHFQIDENQVNKFFVKAHAISLQELHDNEDYITAPCSMKGQITWAGHTLDFVIMASGIARLWGENRSLLLECVRRCDDIFTNQSTAEISAPGK